MGCSNGTVTESKGIEFQRAKSIKLHPIETNCQIISGHKDSISEIIILKDGRLCSSSWDGTIKIWNENDKKICDETFENPNKESLLCCIQIYDETIISGDSDSLIFQFKLNNNEPINTYNGHSEAIYCLLNLNEKEFASCSEDTFINIWEINQSEHEKIKLSGHKGKVNKIILLKNGNLASCSNDCTIKIWEYQNKFCHHTLDSSECCMEIIELKNRKILASYFNKDLKIWDYEKHQCTQLNHSHQNYISFLFEYKEHNILSCSYDGEIEFWNINDNNKQKKGKIKRWHEGNISSVILFGNNFISGGYDNLIKIWPI